MSKKKILKWICRRCMKTHPEVKVEPSTELLRACGFCGTENWCFPVTSSRPVKGGKKAPKEPKMLKEVIDEARIANSEAITTHILKPESGTNTTDTAILDEIIPTETAPEAESAEENEAVADVIEETVEAEIEAAVPEEEPPEEPPLEAESAPSTIEEAFEKEDERFKKGPEETIRLAQKLKNANIARLEAELEALRN